MTREAIDRVLERIGAKRENLIALLQAVQDDCHYLPPEALAYLAGKLGVGEAEVTGVATFYGQFRLRPAGRHRIHVCVGTACHVKGAERTYEAFLRELGIAAGGDTDAAGEFTVEKVACLGCCMLAVAVQVDKTIYGNVTPAKVRAVLDDVRAGEAACAGAREAGHGHAGAKVRLCACSSCAAAGAAEVLREIRRVASVLQLPVAVCEVGCTGGSYHAPLLEIVLEDGLRFRYGRVRVKDVEAVLLSHVRPVRAAVRLRAAVRAWTEQVFAGEGEEPPVRFPLSVRDQPDAPYWLCQQRIATEGAGELPPLGFGEYRRHGGFEAFGCCARGLPPGAVIGMIERSGLRGRGGGGFPTGRKWRAVAEARAAAGETSRAFVVCNGDEGDPGAFMDRMLMESYPFRVLEGLMIAAYAVGASEGVLYIRHEYPLAVRRVREAILRLEAEGMLGAGGTAGLTLRVAEGAGAFVCGEETALLASVEGCRGVPHVRPPYPATCGLFGKPTLVNNVETLALVPWIVRHGADAFRAVGTAGSAGTKAFALAGKVARGGLVEVPMGLPLGEVVERMGGGVGEGHTLKAVQVGGPSGGCVPAALAKTPVDYEALRQVGSMMGSGGLVVLDETDCMVDIARYFLTFTQRESCGTCTACRIGTRRMLEVLERLCAGHGRAGDLELLERLAEVVRSGSLCGLGKTAPNPVLSTLRHFRAEYEAHVRGVCPARKCRALIEYTVSARCIGCTLCAQNCPEEAIAFTPLERAVIRRDVCTRCDICRLVCPEKAIEIADAKRDNGNETTGAFHEPHKE